MEIIEGKPSKRLLPFARNSIGLLARLSKSSDRGVIGFEIELDVQGWYCKLSLGFGLDGTNFGLVVVLDSTSSIEIQRGVADRCPSVIDRFG